MLANGSVKPCKCSPLPTTHSALACGDNDQRWAATNIPQLGREHALDELPFPALIWLAQAITGRAAGTRPDYPRIISTAFDDFMSTRLGQFFGPAADEHPGLSGFSLLSHGREAFIVRLALADLAERSLDCSTTCGMAIRPAGSSSTM